MATITLTQANGFNISLSTFGATWLSCQVPVFSYSKKSASESGLTSISTPTSTQLREILLSCTEAELATQDMYQDMYLGASVGRYANRIANAQYQLADKLYKLSANQDNKHTLHGGADNFAYREWTIIKQSADSVTFELFSADGDQGFNGNLTAQITYTLTADSVIIDYYAECDQTSICALTNHAYFNLNSDKQNTDARNQYLSINSNHYLPINPEGVPLNAHSNNKRDHKQILAEVTDTAFDFTKPKLISQDFAQVKDAPINNVGGYDHDWYLNDRYLNNNCLYNNDFSHNQELSTKLKSACVLQSSSQDLTMSISTTHPALHVYTGNFLHTLFAPFAGVALETGCLADSPNMADFVEDCLISPDKPYQHRTVYRFASQ